MKLYIGNLPFSATEAKVREMLEQYGTLQSFDWITDRDTGRPRGFCFAEMDNADADAAIKALNSKDFGGRNLKVNEARPRNDRRRKRSW
ncbi:MAG: RNA-binding protein [Deltaproteobacteria bacterium]|nr:RNA-binding protein [Deltaproteobacteria bacterium]MBW1947277.1 RNA-binding protein [Deltaproteobacteria bacterium]MBW1966183.1 RNA-binding protein [Deltaproteobacteria bacterium]MBW2097502.1 RNA-binding protein [Deltaproteobacteria bacterium]